MDVKEIDGKLFIDARIDLVPNPDRDKVKPFIGFNKGQLVCCDDAAGLQGDLFDLFVSIKKTINPLEWYLYYMVDTPDIMECRDQEEADRCNTHPSIKHICRSIVSTTYGSLCVPSNIPFKNQAHGFMFPQPTGDFINDFLSKYNNENPISKIMVEVEEDIDSGDKYVIKISKDHTINIKHVV